jgi:hypothetical protein
MKTWIMMVIVTLMANAAIGQVTAEEAAARLKERERAAATDDKPTIGTGPVSITHRECPA